MHILTNKWAYYNEIDPNAAQWIRNLIKAGHIAPGEVDERSIEDVLPSDVRNFIQCHWFAGIATWSYALRQAGWADDREVWTGSCPCQPFSAAGKGKGTNDKRHLWPAFAELILTCRPSIVFGEQVSSSLVTGRKSNANVQRLWERKVYLGILSDWLEKDVSIDMQGLQKQRCEIASRDAKRVNGHQGFQIGGCGEVKGLGEGVAVQPVCGAGSGGSGFRSLRGHWDSLRPDGESRMEHSIDRSNTGGGWIHGLEREGGLVRLECRLRHLGREQNDRNEPGDPESPERAIQLAAEATDRELEKENGQSWVDTLQIDLEGMDYSFGCIPFPASGVGAPHIRDRLYWVAHANNSQPGARGAGGAKGSGVQVGADAGGCSGVVGLDNAHHPRPQRHPGDGGTAGRQGSSGPAPEAGLHGGLDDAGSVGLHTGRHGIDSGDDGQLTGPDGEGGTGPGPANGFWKDVDWLLCRDGKWRPVEPGTFPLAHGAPARVGRLRAYGNAVNAEAARAFIESVMADVEGATA